jgi:mRNA-degrading endonuclease YafQ of YafQ-DinJ toxin-antitoxin module
MFTPVWTNQFWKDVQIAKKRGRDIERLRRVIASLLEQKLLEPNKKPVPYDAL